MDDQAQNDPLFPIAVLIDELKVLQQLLPNIQRDESDVQCFELA